MDKTDHAERTADEPRDPSLHSVILKQIDEVGRSIRLFRLEIPPTVGSIRFLPGQWLDVYVPGLDRPGGFTITSPPSRALRPPAPSSPTEADAQQPPPYLELAVQQSPDNAVAQWLWSPVEDILSSELRVRVGGSFVWPPPGVAPTTIRKLVFVAGGVGVNPLMSIVSHLAEAADQRYSIDFLYSARDPGNANRSASELLFLERLADIFSSDRVRGNLGLFLTSGGRGGGGDGKLPGLDLTFKRRRITVDDVASAVGEYKRSAVVYVCGVPTMTDDFVEGLTSETGVGLERHRVLCEKWW